MIVKKWGCQPCMGFFLLVVVMPSCSLVPLIFVFIVQGLIKSLPLLIHATPLKKKQHSVGVRCFFCFGERFKYGPPASWKLEICSPPPFSFNRSSFTRLSWISSGLLNDMKLSCRVSVHSVYESFESLICQAKELQNISLYVLISEILSHGRLWINSDREKKVPLRHVRRLVPCKQ